ncbi:hypothetical protein L227DRAFT_379045 [Lentinus tigrinus ALCF2SS1-6]|uniref:Uncharacterized protein n=1 Tax=Lentinus tigrinus ALCF2SS1-6 TaxID=1328759 RepID=A0A5C2RQA8_9APHY|nr:hypothetical protein L227DRAFT_379045 [Lentinus tigrinus ALCF2SS1-6]
MRPDVLTEASACRVREDVSNNPYPGFTQLTNKPTGPATSSGSVLAVRMRTHYADPIYIRQLAPCTDHRSPAEMTPGSSGRRLTDACPLASSRVRTTQCSLFSHYSSSSPAPGHLGIWHTPSRTQVVALSLRILDSGLGGNPHREARGAQLLAERPHKRGPQDGSRGAYVRTTDKARTAGPRTRRVRWGETWHRYRYADREATAAAKC